MLGKLVSVIITTYNREKQLSLTLDSILAQTYKNIEIIIVDDFSTDGTKDLIESKNSFLSFLEKLNIQFFSITPLTLFLYFLTISPWKKVHSFLLYD